MSSKYKPIHFNYDFLVAFKHHWLANVIDKEHLLSDGIIRIKSLVYPDGTKDEQDFWGWSFQKGTDRYLLPLYDINKNQRDLKNELPFVPVHKELTADNGLSYNLVTKHAVVKFKPEKKISFKALVDALSCIPHSNMEHKRLVTMLVLTQRFTRANFRVCSPPGFGKDSTVDMLNHLISGCSSIVDASIARLEKEANETKLLCLNEVVDLPKAKWQETEKFLLNAGDFKPVINKRTKKHGSVGEQIDISSLSLLLFYNDITDIPEGQAYLDTTAKAPTLDRFPALRVYGRYTYDFNDSNVVRDIKRFVKENEELYKDLVYTLSYFMNNWEQEGKPFDRSKLVLGSNRQQVSMNRLLDFVSMYCYTQEEFDHWVGVINACQQDYNDMLQFANVLGRVRKKYGEDENDTTKYEVYRSVAKAIPSRTTFAPLIQKGLGVLDSGVSAIQEKELDWWGQ